MFLKIFLGFVSVLYFILVPGNLSILVSLDYGIFGFLAYILYFVGWIFPIIFLYKKNSIVLGKVIGLVIINVLLSVILLHFADIYGVEKEKEMNERMKKIIEIQNK